MYKLSNYFKVNYKPIVYKNGLNEIYKIKFIVLESEIHDKDQLLAPPRPPSKRKLKKAMKLRNKEKAMSSIIWEVMVYFMYIMVLLFLCHGSRDSRGQIINQHIKTTFIETTNGLDTVSVFEKFVH